MYAAAHNIATANQQAVMASALSLSNAVFESTERMTALCLKAARTNLDNTATTTRAILDTKGVEDLTALVLSMAPSVHMFNAYTLGIFKIDSDAKKDVEHVAAPLLCSEPVAADSVTNTVMNAAEGGGISETNGAEVNRSKVKTAVATSAKKQTASSPSKAKKATRSTGQARTGSRNK